MIVLDCCAAIEMIRRTPEGNALRKLMLSDEKTISSQLFLIEAANALAKFIKAGLHHPEDYAERLREAASLVDEVISIEENYIEAAREGLHFGHSAYDMLYFTLARRNAATLFTLDQKLIALCEQEGVDCVHLIDLV